ncbi:MAG: DegT/DnrJ/EryC1/StrS family aminotransferase [Paracoccaceae bacterium]|nr:DegT/DnrJ/EryC1/StrS family aminotransferase [Paracoccaceae bacterium]
MREVFEKSFTQQAPIPEAGIARAVEVMRSGKLHRYNTAPGETSETQRLEAEFAAATHARFALAVASGGYAMRLALRAHGIGPGDRVLSNAFTLAPVPGAIASLGAEPVFVGTTEDLTIDLDDLKAKAGRAEVLLLSHMRGHIADMDRVMAIARDAGLTVIEDCAHTMGAYWGDVPSGRHGLIGCYSTQTYKHANSGEGGFVVTDDADLAAKMVLMSGSYMFYDRHGAAPDAEAFEALAGEMPNLSGRMDNLRAAILRPQIAALPENAAAWNALYRTVEAGLRGTPGLRIIERPAPERFVGSSIQFLLLDWPDAAIEAVLAGTRARGVELKWFGAPRPQGFTSIYRHWSYARPDPMPASDRVLRAILDMRLPLTFSADDCRLIARIVADEVARAAPHLAAE